MKALMSWLLLSLLFWLAGCASAPRKAGRANVSAEPRQPELVYYEAVNKVGPPQDLQLLFLLMAQYSNANKQAEGVEFLSARLQGIWASAHGLTKGPLP